MTFFSTRRRSGLVTSFVAAFVFLGVGFAAAPAAGTSADGDISVRSKTHTCFGNTGTFKDGTDVLEIDWKYAVPECFGIAPSGAIYHTWQGADAWYEMPGNGRADDMARLDDEGNGDRTVLVWAEVLWCQDYRYGSGWTGSWYRCV